MLEYLRIRNLALIEDMELEFAPGMNVLTGETGAGKSFILKALGFLLGDKLTADMVRPGAERAQVEALFSLPDQDLILRRELLAESGRSRLYVNDSLRSQDSLRELRGRLVSHTSQHAQQKLLQPAVQARLLEHGLADPELLSQRDALLEQLREVAARREALRRKQADLAERRELLEMQQQEIAKAAPEPGEEERLEALRAKVRATERRREDRDQALALLHGGEGEGLLDQLVRLEKLLERLAEEDENCVATAEAAAALREQLTDLARRLRRGPADNDLPDVDKVEERLFVLAQLKRKLHRTLPEILALQEEIAQNLSFLDVCTLDLHRLDAEEAALAARLRAVLERLRPARREAAAATVQRLEEELRGLGFSDQVRVLADFAPQEVWPGLEDERGRILWAPNPGQPPQPLDKIASGGELSRFLLALASVRQDETENAIFIFDEVDAGVGGLTLNKLAEKLSALAEKRQMLLITHWPQLAVRARKHFQIVKTVREGATFTLCTPLEKQARHAELARMAGGGPQGEALARSLEAAG
ncbi:DNA repair protein RecN [Desulfovibrio legallii]|jgi:DNA repair protein RecN (Recombination protein N)|uniref:DNA repair protein RecN n=1 Tax=Desulfovibrio legallii TaxID=571438 RepID=A0A1G7QZR9_9BACT|nr:AAA family ATPase [Desulfovibrio legallii]SDG03180.1 DNA replication and repair protein RecN [Desulfovibrio legallii]